MTTNSTHPWDELLEAIEPVFEMIHRTDVDDVTVITARRSFSERFARSTPTGIYTAIAGVDGHDVVILPDGKHVDPELNRPANEFVTWLANADI